MKLAVSNIAWPPEDRCKAYELLAHYGCDGLEIAPGLFFHDAVDPFNPDKHSSDRALEEIRAAGLKLVSMQSLLFGTQEAALFGSREEQATFIRGIERAISLADQYEIKNLVFGSPGQRRIPDGMSAKDAAEMASEIFTKLGDKAKSAGTSLGIEFNPETYGTNFVNHAEEALSLVQKIGHPSITMILDVGALHMNDRFEHLEELAETAVDLVSHVHLSEPNLAPAPACSDQAARVLGAMTKNGYDRYYSIEMKAQPDSLQNLEACLKTLVEAVKKADNIEAAYE